MQREDRANRRLQTEKQMEEHKKELKAIEQFEKSETGLLSSPSIQQTPAATTHASSSSSASSVTPPNNKEQPEGDETTKLAQIALEKTMKDRQDYWQQMHEKRGGFWIPMYTPEKQLNQEVLIAKPSTFTVDPMCGKPIKVKNLIEIEFTMTHTANSLKPDETGRYECPCCRKTLTNALKVFVLSDCGHTICSPCFDKFVSKDSVCYVCGDAFRGKGQDVVQLVCSGTGFAGHEHSQEQLVASTYTPMIGFS